MLIYLSPTVRSVHTLVPFDRRGDRVGRLLTTDHELIRLAAVHGFRTADRTVFAPVLAKVSTGGAALPDTKPGASEGPYEHGSGTLRVLAGSELTDLQPILDQARAATGVTVQLTVTGTLDGVQAVVDGTASRKYDAIWFSSDHYLRLHPETAGRIGTETKIATSPVVFGLRASVAQQLGWDRLMAEIDWFSDHRIRYVFCADANFGIRKRDIEISMALSARRNRSSTRFTDARTS